MATIRQRQSHSVVYALASSGSPENIRYIGKTAWHPDFRLKNHINKARRHATAYVGSWIRSILSKGEHPVMRVRLLSDHDTAGFYERLLIQHFKTNYKLTNLTEGGDGVVGLRHSEASRKRMSEAHKGVPLSDSHRAGVVAVLERVRGLPHIKQLRAETIRKTTARPEVRQRISAAMKGKKHSEEWVRKVALARTGKTASEETKKKMSESHRKRYQNPDARAALKLRRRPDPEKHRKAVIEWWAKRKGGDVSPL